MGILFLRILAFIGLMLMSPLIIFSCVLIFLEDGNPLFFVQDRLGKNQKIFKLYKIRTMLKETPNVGTHIVNKTNFLKTGLILRELKIDELPQVYNFILGDVALVGPRPSLPNQEELNELRISYDIFNATPGITGLAQVLGFDMSAPKDLVKIDRLYINNKTFKLDSLIFLATFIKSLRKCLRLKFQSSIDELKL